MSPIDRCSTKKSGRSDRPTPTLCEQPTRQTTSCWRLSTNSLIWKRLALMRRFMLARSSESEAAAAVSEAQRRGRRKTQRSLTMESAKMLPKMLPWIRWSLTQRGGGRRPLSASEEEGRRSHSSPLVQSWPWDAQKVCFIIPFQCQQQLCGCSSRPPCGSLRLLAALHIPLADFSHSFVSLLAGWMAAKVMRGVLFCRSFVVALTNIDRVASACHVPFFVVSRQTQKLAPRGLRSLLEDLCFAFPPAMRHVIAHPHFSVSARSCATQLTNSTYLATNNSSDVSVNSLALLKDIPDPSWEVWLGCRLASWKKTSPANAGSLKRHLRQAACCGVRLCLMEICRFARTSTSWLWSERHWFLRIGEEKLGGDTGRRWLSCWRPQGSKTRRPFASRPTGPASRTLSGCHAWLFLRGKCVFIFNFFLSETSASTLFCSWRVVLIIGLHLCMCPRHAEYAERLDEAHWLLFLSCAPRGQPCQMEHAPQLRVTGLCGERSETKEVARPDVEATETCPYLVACASQWRPQSLLAVTQMWWSHGNRGIKAWTSLSRVLGVCGLSA